MSCKANYSTFRASRIYKIAKKKTARVRKRKAESAELLTSSPLTKQLVDNVALKQKKTQKKKTQKAQKTNRASSKNKTVISETQEDNWSTPCITCSRRYNEPPCDILTQCKACRGWYRDSCRPDDVDLCNNCVN